MSQIYFGWCHLYLPLEAFDASIWVLTKNLNILCNGVTLQKPKYLKTNRPTLFKLKPVVDLTFNLWNDQHCHRYAGWVGSYS